MDLWGVLLLILDMSDVVPMAYVHDCPLELHILIIKILLLILLLSAPNFLESQLLLVLVGRWRCRHLVLRPTAKIESSLSILVPQVCVLVLIIG